MPQHRSGAELRFYLLYYVKVMSRCADIYAGVALGALSAAQSA
jgi:hypothetical protein